MTEEDSFSINWTNLTYRVRRSLLSRLFLRRHQTPTDILNGVSGSVTAGEVVGLLGSSGSGKTVLMECLVGKRTSGLTGHISVHGRHDVNKMKLSYIPQDEKMSEGLTVREAIMFSSRLQNSTDIISKEHIQVPEGQSIHDYLTGKIISQLGLDKCANNYCTRCSGGQQKRISLAMELVSMPDVLILDEPISGLDSAACLSVIKLLSAIAQGDNISRKKVAVLISLHQPTWPVFVELTKVIVLCREGGKVFYYGHPTETTKFLKDVGVDVSSEDNPADTLMEASCGCFGQEVFVKADDMRPQFADVKEIRPLKRMSTSNVSFFRSTVILTTRQIIVSLRDLMVMNMRFATSIGMVPLLALIFEDSGDFASCPPDFNETVKNISQSLTRKSNDSNPNSFVLHMMMSNLQKLGNLHTNVDLLFFLMFMGFMVGVAPGIFALPKQFTAMKKETFNKWYSFLAYYLSVTISEGLFAAVFVTLLMVPTYYATDQVDEFWRLASFFGILYLLALIGQGFSTIVVTPFVADPSAGIYMVIVTSVPLLTFSGEFTDFRNIKEYLYYISMFDFFQWAYLAIDICLYGYERCGDSRDLWRNHENIRQAVFDSVKWINSNTTKIWVFVNRSVVAGRDQTQDILSLSEIVSEALTSDYISGDGEIGSLVMAQKSLQDDDLWKAIIFMIVFLIGFRILGYVILYNKTRSTS